MTLIELFQDHGVDFRIGGEHPNVRPGWVAVECFQCSGTTRFKLAIHLGSLAATCWACGRMRLDAVLRETLRVPQHEAIRLAIALRGDRPAFAAEPRARAGKVEYPVGLGDLLPAHRRYLESRNLDPDEMVRLWGLRGIANAARLPWRIWIPIHHQEEVVSWTTRAIGSHVAKRYHAASPEQEKVSPKSLLFGEDFCRHAIIVCEGSFDVFRIGPGAIATMGVDYSITQVGRMSKYPLRVVCMDNEPAAQRRARQLASDLGAFDGETVNVVLDTKDAGSASDAEIAELRKRFLE